MPFAWLQAHTHPALELRIDRLATRDTEECHDYASDRTGPTLQEQLPGLGTAGM
ncbi:MAG TPA: hypothetical protein VID48_14965 [Solirubrobacteraceae bacterium]